MNMLKERENIEDHNDFECIFKNGKVLLVWTCIIVSYTAQ